MPRKQLSREIRSLRAIADNPALPALIQSLPARDLAQLCGRIGVGDAMHIMALAPAERLVQALEASVWKTPRPGVSEVFDARELVAWICAWLDIGEGFTAERLAAVPDENLTLYLSQVASVTTTAMWGFERSTEVGDLERIYAPSHDETAYGPYVVSARCREDWETRRHLAGLAGAPITEGSEGAEDGKPVTPGPDMSHLATLQTALEDAGLLDRPPERLLLAHEATSRQLPIVKLLRVLAENDAAEFDARGRELAYLVSLLIAGIAVDGTALSPTEARGAALATCNLGSETLRSQGERVRIDREPGLVRLFLVGLNVLNALPGRVLESFAQCLKTLRKASSEPLHEWLVEQAEVSVTELREAVGSGDFEAAREAAMALCFVFEPHACQAVVPLLDELPRLGTADGRAATWIDSMAAIASAAELLRTIDAKRRRRS